MDSKGKIADITLDIAESLSEGGFSSASCGIVTKFAENLSDGICLSCSNTKITLIPKLISGGNLLNDIKDIGQQMFSKAKLLDNNTVSYIYDDKTAIDYSLTYNGFKENIVVSEYTGQTEYTFSLYTNGLKLIECDGSYYLTDENDIVKAALGEIYILTADEKNNTIGQLKADTVVANQEYLLTIMVDPDFLKSEETAYPICIDPTLELVYNGNNSGAIDDVTIHSKTGSNGSCASLYLGNREKEGISRVLMKFPGLDLNSLGDNITVTSAKVELRDLMCESKELEISCYVFTGNKWNESSANWSNVNPNSYSDFLSSNKVSYNNGCKQATSHRYSFDITKAVEGWLLGNYDPEKGIIFKASAAVESSSSHDTKTFAAYERTSYKPSLSVTYSTSGSIIPTNTYYLNNRYSGEYLRYASSGVSLAQGMIATFEDEIRWEILPVTSGYVIRSKDDASKYLGVPQSTGSSAVQTYTIKESAIPEWCIWNISVAADSGCLVKSRYNSRYLYSKVNSLCTVSNTYSAGTDNYDSCVWRIVSTSEYGSSSKYKYRELQSAISINNMITDLGSKTDININGITSNMLWTDKSDFIYKYVSGTQSNTDIDVNKGTISTSSMGITKYNVTHKVTGKTCYFTIYSGQYAYELVCSKSFGFDESTAILILQLYDKIDEVYADEGELEKAWRCARILSEFEYDGYLVLKGFETSIRHWDDVAGSVTNNENREDYFIKTLGYNKTQYNALNLALKQQYNQANSLGQIDFCHFQYSLSSRLAYKLNKTGFISNLYTGSDDETVSYLAGWLGDATITNDKTHTTSFGNDDYLADLDAENIYQLIAIGGDDLTSINSYYRYIEKGGNRATRFQTYIDYNEVYFRIINKMDARGKNLADIQNNYPDTYDFLMSLKNNCNIMKHY